MDLAGQKWNAFAVSTVYLLRLLIKLSQDKRNPTGKKKEC